MKLLTAVAVTTATIAQASAGDRGGWDVKTYANNMVYAYAAGEQLGEWLGIECKYGKASALILVPGNVFSDGERVSIVISVDGKPRTRGFFWNTSGQLVANMYRDTYSSIEKSASIKIDAHGERGGRVSMAFHPGASRKRLSPLLRSCPLSSAREGDWPRYDPREPEFP